MKGPEGFQEQIMAQWAGHYGCTVAELMEPANVVVPKKQEDDQGFHIWYLGERTFIETDPLYADTLNASVQRLPAGHRFGEADARALIADGRIEQVSISEVSDGLLHYLYADDLSPVIATPGYEIRRQGMRYGR